MPGIGIGISPVLKRNSGGASPSITGFKTQWLIPSSSYSVTLPLVNTRTEGALSYNCTVNWGDGNTTTVTSWNDANATHIYATAGTYDIEIQGTCEGWSFNNTNANRTAIKKVLSWGDVSLFNGFKYLSGGFYGCSALNQIPTNEKIPASGTGILSQGFASLFRECVLLGAGVPIPTGLFDNHPLAQSFSLTFSSTIFSSIPSGLFNLNTAVTTFANCFASTSANTSITSVPTDLFRYNTAVTTFSATFSNRANLATIPTDLFRYNTSVTTFFSTFANCTSLATIPTDLFRYNTSVTNFQSTFIGSGIVSIPVDTFRYNTAVTTFTLSTNGCFKNCTSLTTIPTDLFRYNTLVTASGMANLFEGCTSLATIPTDLFRYNTLITSAQGIFKNCSALTIVPANLFKYNTLLTSFVGTFDGCIAMQQTADIFYAAGEQATRFAGKTVNFTNCFLRGSFTGVQGTAPDLWNCTFTASTKTLCWGNTGNSLTSLTNYASIPVAWV